MNTVNRTRAGLYAITLVITLSLLCASSTLVFSTQDPVEVDMPDVLVWIDAGNPGAHRISFTYPELIERSKAEEHLHRLLSATGWIPISAEITDDSNDEFIEHPMTSVDIVVPEVVRIDSGVLPLEPIITALKDLESQMILFMVPPGFQFQGLEDFENSYVDIEFKESTSTYQYLVTVKNSSFETLDLPIYGPRAVANVETDTEPGSRVLAFVLVIVLALLAAFFAYMITSRIAARGARNRNQRS